MTSNISQGSITARKPRLRIEPTHGWSRLALHELWEYRELLYFLTMRDIKGRYRQMALGPLWIIIKPVINMVIFRVIFAPKPCHASAGRSSRSSIHSRRNAELRIAYCVFHKT